MFLKNIILCKGNPMTIKYYSYKIEFALRGASHVHGVLWVDWNKLDIFPKEDIDKLNDAFKKIKDDIRLGDDEKLPVWVLEDSLSIGF